MSPRKKASSGRAFTVEFPTPLPVEQRGDAWWMEADGRELRLSNLDKVFWPDEGYTKGDLLAYYFNVAELILPYLRERPLTMKRMPDGMAGPFFYEKTAPSHTPDWIARCHVLSDDSKDGVIGYLMVNDLSTLLFVANLGCIEMHPLHSRCATIDTPDYFFFDLDPMGASFEDVLIVSRHVRAALGALGLTGYPKTSGATGIQIYVPVEPGWSYDQVRDFVGTLGRTIERADREHVTMAWQIDKRTGKVFIDHNMNRRGANISAVYSLRPEAGATVSTPLLWEEVDEGVTPQDFRIDNVFERFDKLGDRFEAVRTSPQELGPALEAVGLPSTKAIEVGRDAAPDLRGGDRRLEGPRPGRVPAQAVVRARGHARAAPGRGRGRGQLVRDPQAPRDAPALRRPARTRRRAPLVGRAEGPADPTRRQAPGRADRGPPARVRVVPGHDPRGPLRRGRGADLRRRLVRAGRVDRLEGELPAARPPVPGARVPLRQDADRLARLPRLPPGGRR